MAVQLGRPDPFKLADEIDSATFSYWLAYSELNPFGQSRDNIHAGMIASMIANVNRKKGSPAISAADFLLVDAQTQKDQKQKDFIAFLGAVAVPKED